jgi:predicted nucleic acid-binding protein
MGDVGALIRYADHRVRIEASVITRASTLGAMGFSAYDALHLACAEQAKVDVFLTTDDNLLRLANDSSGLLEVRVGNPLTWLKEVI